MNCYTSGILGIAFLGASFSSLTVSQYQKDILLSTLPHHLFDKYVEIIHERRSIFFTGLILGLILAVLITNNTKTNNEFHRITLFCLITIAFSVFYYFLIPKSDYMLNHLTNNEQNQAWLAVYKLMKRRYIMGFLLSALAALFISQYFCQ